MFSFVPNIAEALTTELQQLENKACMAELWRSQNRAASFTQSLCLTPTGTNSRGELVHSIHVVPNDYGDRSKENRFLGSYSPGITVARRCYICDDPFCPNIIALNESNPVLCAQSDSVDVLHGEEPAKKSLGAGLGSFCAVENSGILSERDGSVPDEGSRGIMSPNEKQQNALSTREQKSLDSSKTPQVSRASFEKEEKSRFGARKKLVFETLQKLKLPVRGKNRNTVNANFQSRANVNSFESSQSQTESSGVVLSDYLKKGDNSTASCCCKGPYHCHTFEEKTRHHSFVHHHKDNDDKTMAKFASPGKPVRRIDNQISLDRSSQSSQSNLLHYSEKDNHRNICMTFWKPQLSFSPYKYGDKLVEYSSLWPSEQSLRKTMSEVCHDTVLRRAVLDMCKMSLRCGPVRLLKALLGLKLVNLDQLFEDGSGMLHLALIARNAEAVQFLCQEGIPPKIRDKFGHPADQVCFSAQLRKLLPQRYLISNSSHSPRSGKALIFPTQHDVESIFYLAQSSKHFDELQKKLQTYEFDVNSHCDSKGDYLVHIATKGGLSQLPLLLTLVRIQGADIELCNNAGLTPLMIAAQNGEAVLCDVLLCVFGCNPNKPNPSSGAYALHCACVNNSAEVVNVLLNRGADFNLEDLEGRRPDDATSALDADECRAILRSQRIQRSEYLSGLIEKGVPFESEVRYTDLCVVDEVGRTLIMVAAENNKVEHLEQLLAVEGSPIDAQHEKTGQSALSIAARAGNMETVRVLLSRDANPGIPDLHGYLPLHYAVMNGHGDVLETMLEFFPKTYTGLHMASKLAVNSAIHNRIKAAIQKRKEEILTPELYDCALTGDGERLFRVLEDGDNVNLKREVAPLYLAVENGHLDVIKLLYERGGDITRRHPVTQATVLHAAAKMGHSEVVEFLLQFCRPVTPPAYTLMSKQKDKKFSYMPYQCLKHSYYKELDVNALDGDGKTPLQLAADKGYRTIVKLLLDQDATTALLGEQGELIKCPEYEGVRIMIESYREHHTSQVMKWIMDRKGLNNLRQIWLPRFDHNLRDRQGNTPLMVACKTGCMDVVRFLLESAVYTTTASEDNVSEDSDTDSGLERTSNRTPSMNKRGELGEDVSCPDSQSSRFAISVLLQPARGTSLHPGTSRAPTPSSQVPRSHSAQFGQPAGTLRRSPSWNTLNLEDWTFLPQRPDREPDLLMSLPATLVKSESESLISNSKYVMTKLMTDLRKPKGLEIYHDNRVCHVCSVNLLDGNTALHRTIEGGDNLPLAKLLIDHDHAVAHTQNFQGYSPLHLACKFGRKKIVQMLLCLSDIDVHCLTADGQQAEELCSSKAVRKLLVKARTENPQPETSNSPSRSLYTSSYNDDTATTINLDKIRDKYQALKRDLHKDDSLL